MIRIGLVFIFVLSVGCSEDRKFEDFTHEDGSKGTQEFRADSQMCTKEKDKCEKDKDKYSNKIQGRELGFEGEHTGYLGCMKMKGWSQKSVS